MAAFARGPDDITARLDNVIEHFQGDTDPGGTHARAQIKLLLDAIEHFLSYAPDSKRAPVAVLWTTRQRPA